VQNSKSPYRIAFIVTNKKKEKIQARHKVLKRAECKQ
jgi:hypothetical protein